VHIGNQNADFTLGTGRREKTAQYTVTASTMQGKCLINGRILTVLAALVALKNCNNQLQKLGVLPCIEPVCPTQSIKRNTMPVNNNTICYKQPNVPTRQPD
jgi:hypothetical protein